MSIGAKLIEEWGLDEVIEGYIVAVGRRMKENPALKPYYIRLCELAARRDTSGWLEAIIYGTPAAEVDA